MRSLIFLVLASLAFAAAPMRAQSNGDPGDLFVNAYMAVQQGEKAEQAGNFKVALTKLRYAAGVLDSISDRSAAWQPEIVKYRKARTAEAITRVQEKIARFGNGKGSTVEMPGGLETSPLPQAEDEKPLIFETPDPVLSASSSPSSGAARSTSRRTGSERSAESDPLEEAAQRMKKLQVDLRNAKDEAERLQSEKADLARKLEEAAKARAASEEKQQLLQNAQTMQSRP